MASAEAALYSILTAPGSPVRVLINTRVYPLALPQGCVFPACRYQRISTARSPYRTLDGLASYASVRFQIDSFGTTHGSVLSVSQAVVSLLEGLSTTAGGIRVDYISVDDEGSDLEEGAGPAGAHLYRQRVDVILAHDETWLTP